MYADYETLVIRDYNRKKNDNTLRTALIRPTRTKIKNECIRLCKGNIEPYDERVIKEFCDDWDDTKTCLQNIRKYDDGKFYALAKFMNGQSTSTDQKNILLLAWLIDFPHRPFDYDKDYSRLIDFQDAVEKNGPSPIEGTTPTSPPPGEEFLISNENTSGNQPITHRARRLNMVLIAGVILAVMGMGGCWWWSSVATEKIPKASVGCMYWNIDHYQPIPCDQKMPNTLVIALDMEKVKNFRKIMQPDTITNRAKGHVWYSKIDNKVEFFTADGNHPIVIDKTLRHITDYIIDTYIYPGMPVY